jgi:hypothetical protein
LKAPHPSHFKNGPENWSPTQHLSDRSTPLVSQIQLSKSGNSQIA